MSLSIRAAERSILPDTSIRWGIRRLLRRRIRDLHAQAEVLQEAVPSYWLREMREGPIAVATDSANEQHYEVPAEFYRLCLGRHLKYSSCYWDEAAADLSQAEARMLAMTCLRARLEDGQDILELGCGWGSLSLWMAEHYPSSRILSISNSVGQREYILDQAEERGLENLEVRTVDINDFHPGRRFDRVVSVEMFEHMRNWESLLQAVSGWLRPEGKVFLHFFSHREASYPFEDRGQDDWMARNFFTGGLMPSHDLPRRLDIPFEVEQDWPESGLHYARTAEAWLDNLDLHRAEALAVLEQAGAGDKGSAGRQLQRWRMFFMACAELFGFRQGSEWIVSHYLLQPRAGRAER